MKFILRLGLALLTGFVSVCTASAQAYGTADTNAPELRVPKSVQPAQGQHWGPMATTISPEPLLPPSATSRDKGIAGTGMTVCICGAPKI